MVSLRMYDDDDDLSAEYRLHIETSTLEKFKKLVENEYNIILVVVVAKIVLSVL